MLPTSVLDARRATLVEREREIDVLDALIAEAEAGTGHLALIEGPAGIGKSQLLAEARDRASASMTVLSARASDLEREFPFGVVRQLFEARVAAEPDRALAGAAQAAEAVFAVDGHESGSFAALHGLFWLALNLAEERPLLLAIDDLQWCDRPSLRFVGYLSRRLDGVRILVAGTQRTSDPGTDPALLADIAHDPATVPLRPRPLTAAGVRQLVCDRLGAEADEAFCDACRESTGGNPLLLGQLLTALAADGVRPVAANTTLVGDVGPRAVSRTVLTRLARLPGATRAVARAVAVLGESAGLTTVAAQAGVSEHDVAAASGELARAEILRPEPPLGFVHPLVRDAVYSELSPGERELQHARAAALLRDAGASPDQVAAQLLNAPPRGMPWVSELLHEAGVAAKRRGAADNAVAYLRRALDEPPPDAARAELLYDLGLAESLTSAPPAIEHLRAAYETLDDLDMRVRSAFELVRLWCFSETPERGIAIARDAAALLPPERLDDRRKLEAAEYMAAYFVADERGSVPAGEAYRDGIDASGAPARMLEAMTAYRWMIDGGPADRCAALALRALAGNELIDRDESFFVIAAMVVLAAADRDEAMPTWERIQAAAHRSGSLFAALGVHLWSGFTLLRRGDLREAESLVRQAVDEMALWGTVGRPGMTYGHGILAEILVERGELAAAADVLAEAPEPIGPTDGENFVRRARVGLALARGANDEALAAAEDYVEHGSQIVNPAYSGARSLRALALARVGRTEEALADAEEEVRLARRFGAPRAVGRSLRILGSIRGDAGFEHLREAVDVLAPSPAKLEHARALAALGAALRRARKPTEARQPLREALDLAAVCGAEGLVEDVRTELYATGARPRGDALQGVASLTPSERRVAGLAAEGDTNKAIAQTLFVTPKTIELHLSSVYRKLGIRSRRELPAALTGA